ncbi:hypothetical protein [Cryobacterium sp. Hb1]|uniref:hypothetical protein n=1 Tax=Cryobacterium sp. Hb1 TaxID=1259147 RepID=UPI001069C502|nr:hypothetical protein [Cryobacterium sp. Hb1]TFD72134.1 hypothetical protein E3T38_01165 [Cryobacterium sp. Hb1]
MNTSQRKIGLCIMVAITAITISGCAQIDAAVNDMVPTFPSSTSASSVESEKAAVPELSATETAQRDSGLSIEEYQAGQDVLNVLAAEYNSLALSGGDTAGFFDSGFADLEARFGKPVVLVAYYPCPPKNNGGAMSWGITGALPGIPGPTCGVGYGSALDLMLDTVDVRADRKGWIPGDWVTFIVE